MVDAMDADVNGSTGSNLGLHKGTKAAQQDTAYGTRISMRARIRQMPVGHKSKRRFSRWAQGKRS